MSFITLEQIDQVEKMPGYHGRFVHSETMTTARWSIEADAPFPEHSHPHEQVSIVLEGEFEMTIAGETQILRPGVVAIIPADTAHSGIALSECDILDVFHPVREDYR